MADILDPIGESKIIRTISSYVSLKDKNRNNIFDFMSSESKNIYNATLFHTNLFLKYQNAIFKDLLFMVNGKILLDPNQFDTEFYKLYDKYYSTHIKHKPIIENNNNIIYTFIINYLVDNKITLVNNNLFDTEINIINELIKQRLFVIPCKEYENELFLDIVRRIIKSIYSKNYTKLKNEILHNIPCSIQNLDFIEQVKSGEYFYTKKTIPNYKNLLSKHKLFNPDGHLEKITKKTDGVKEKKKPSFIKSNQNYISRIIYRYYTNCKIPSDLMCNIILKAYKSYSSYFALLKNGLYANKPKYLEKNDHYILPFFTRSRKLDPIQKSYRLTIGKYISNNYQYVIDNDQYVCLNPNQKTDYKKYVLKKYLTHSDNIKTVPKNNNYIDGNYFIDKKSTYIIDAYYTYLRQPSILKNKKLLLIEVVPLYNEGCNYKINYSYEESKIENIPIKGKSISIDLGMGNLMAIHDPNGNQYIIKGSHVININNYYNVLIDEHRSELASHNKNNIRIEKKTGKIKFKCITFEEAHKKFKNDTNPDQEKNPNPIRQTRKSEKNKNFVKIINHIEKLDKDDKKKPIQTVDKKTNPEKIDRNPLFHESLKTSIRMRRLLRRRNDAINDHFNNIVTWMLKKYGDCEHIVVGYNDGWKTKVNMGKKTNRKFYEIPYRKLLTKLQNKMEVNGQKLEIIEESYTSKCDGLALEEIKKHESYLGKRIKRGLFSSSVGKLINADINGAINIMRKWRKRNGKKDISIEGNDLCNPITVRLDDLKLALKVNQEATNVHG